MANEDGPTESTEKERKGEGKEEKSERVGNGRERNEKKGGDGDRGGAGAAQTRREGEGETKERLGSSTKKKKKKKGPRVFTTRRIHRRHRRMQRVEEGDGGRTISDDELSMSGPPDRPRNVNATDGTVQLVNFNLISYAGNMMKERRI